MSMMAAPAGTRSVLPMTSRIDRQALAPSPTIRATAATVLVSVTALLLVTRTVRSDRAVR